MSGLYKDPEGKEIFKKSMVSSHPSNTIKGSHDESEVLDLKERIKKLESEAKERDVSTL